ncbi:MAG: helix-turn-helix domain-containing protein [Spirochaetales bacterium]|nr:helix-turn-helix domain-containing protein [Spirochaetales bacterium]
MNNNDFNDLVDSIKQAGEIKTGSMKPERIFHFNPIDIKKIREKLHKSQTEFAIMIGISVGTLRNWEQGRRYPEGPARALLQIAASNPEVFEKVLV